MHVTLVGKPGCHLCDQARLIVAEVCARTAVPWEERSILDDPVLADRYAEQIPVVLVGDAVHDFWRVDPQRLAAAIHEAQAVD